MKNKDKINDSNAVYTVFLFNLIDNRIEKQDQKNKQGQSGINTGKKRRQQSIRPPRIIYTLGGRMDCGKGSN